MAETGTTDRQSGFSRVAVLRGVAGLIALLVAWIHVLHPRLGAQRLSLYVEVGTLYDPRPPLFVLVAVLIIGGLILVQLDVLPRRYCYAGGMVLMAALLAGYLAWHLVLDHGAFWPHIEAHGHDEIGPLRSVVLHLRGDRLALASKTAEAALLVALAALYRLEAAERP